MYRVKDFLSKIDEEAIIEAIVIAEKATSGEIRVHIEDNATDTPLDRAQEVFFALGMDKTKDRNGVLFYICAKKHHFVILGDEAINQKVDARFWENTKDMVLSHFKKNNYKQGLIEGIIKVGEFLQKFFPSIEEKQNQLPNEISK
ncbi:MAG: TPM domain-containing protein [Bacteroidota bacterium]|nr:TPM domain-containing protein [Bacteroidota bacterium]